MDAAGNGVGSGWNLLAFKTEIWCFSRALADSDFLLGSVCSVPGLFLVQSAVLWQVHELHGQHVGLLNGALGDHGRSGHCSRGCRSRCGSLARPLVRTFCPPVPLPATNAAIAVEDPILEASSRSIVKTPFAPLALGELPTFALAGRVGSL